jgi:hypothetical protein
MSTGAAVWTGFWGTDRESTVRRLRALAWLLDARWRLPGTRFRFGADAVIGLAPVVGDALMAVTSLYIVYEGARLGASDRVLARMLLNVLVEFVAGSVPVAGDLFDAAWKANLRNLALLGIDAREA